MTDEVRTRDQLFAELSELRRKAAELEARLGQSTRPFAQRGTEHEVLQDEIEKRTLLEQELDAAERLYQTLVETAKDIIWTVDLNLRYTYVSPSVTEALGYTVEEIMALRPLDILTPDSQAKIIKAFQEELALEASGPREKYTSRTEEIEQYHKDGSTRWEEITTTFLRDRLGQPIGILGISHDITERRRLEDELRQARDELEQRVDQRTDELLRSITRLQEEVRERKQAEDGLRISEQRLELVLDGADLGLWDWHVQSRGVVFNRRSAEIVGYALEEIRQGLDFWENLLHPEDRIRALETVRAHLEGRTAHYEDEYRVKAKSGEWRRIVSRGKVVERDLDGKPLRMVGTYRDITDSKIAEDELRQSRERLSLALEGASLGIWEWDLNTGKALWDERTLSMLGYESHEFEHNLKNWKRIVHPEDWPRVSENLNLHLGGQLPTFEAEYRALDSARSWRWLHARGKVVEFDATQRPTRMTGIVVDITDRKKAEEALRVSEKAHKTLAENIPGIVYRVHFDDQTTMEFFNHEVESITGYAEEELRTGEVCSIDPLILSEDRSKVVELVKQAFNDNAPFEVEYRIRDKKGAIRYLLEYGRPIRGAAGSKSFIDGVIFDNTDRKRAEEALRVSEDKFSKAFHASPDVLIISQRDTGQIIETNEKWESTFGYNREEVIGRTSLELGLFENPEVRSSLIRQLEEQGFVRDFEVNIQRRSGEIRHTLLSAESLEIGGEACLLTIIRDITDRMKAEEALAKSEELQRTILSTSPVGIGLAVGRSMVWVNDAWKEMFGLGPHDADPLTIKARALYPTLEEFERVGKVLYEGLEAGQANETDATMMRKDGTIVDVHIAMKAVDPSDPSRGTIAAITDITEQKMAEKALKESEARYRHLFDNSPVGIVSIDIEGRILEVNQSLLEILGSPSAEATRKVNIFELPQLVESGISDACRWCMETGERALNEFPYASLWGKQSHLRIMLTPVISQEGTTRGCQATIEDITQQRALEEQLRQAQKMEAVGTLAGGIAHDFNNLLHIISGHAELLDMELVERKLKFGELDAIRQAANRGADLVKQILTFSRRIDAKFQCINLNEEVRSTERLLYRTIPKMIEIDLHLDEELDSVRADSTQIEQMLINMAVNAKDAMPEGGRLAIETRNVNIDEHYCKSHVEIVPGRYVLLKISDTGHGMEEKVRQHIFEPFFTTKGLADGTGLGLATVFGIVKMHGGHITCQSELGKGTTFEVYFPVAETAKPEVVGDQKVGAVAGGTETILVVDDEELIRHLAKRILEKSGYSVLTADSGKEGIEIYARHKSEISLVILDLIMPKMGGKQCLEELLKINPQVKILVASGFAVRGDTKAFLDTEAKGIVPKPFNMRELLRSVRHVLDGIYTGCQK